MNRRVGGDLLQCSNPLSATVAIWNHIVVIFNVLAQKGFIGTWDISRVNIPDEKCLLMGGCRMYGLQGMSSPYMRHPPILASQEQLALRRVYQVSLLFVYESKGKGRFISILWKPFDMFPGHTREKS